ncbi:MAG TPA: PAS domain-containing sensor histidine kinase [Acidimicrobiales bacterium]|nr:PAS domain-containing sensor histidine kinase [Acidimicrobiales bacterium]
MSERETSRPSVSLAEAAKYLSLPEESVRSLAAAGYVEASTDSSEPVFKMVDLKAFLARNADNGSGNLLELAEDDPDPQVLLDDLDARSEDMARRAFDIFAAAIPEARGWSLSERARFIAQSKSRFEAILAVTGQGAEVDEALVDDLQEVGAAAAWAQSPLPQLLVTLRISRDLVVQTSVELAEERGGRWGLALSLLLTRVLPAMDRLTDALAQGYWSAMVAREEEASARYAYVVEHSSDGVWEVDLDGCIQYANPALALLLGRDVEDLEGTLLTEALVGDETDRISLDRLTPSAAVPSEPFELAIRRADGVRRVLAVRVQARLQDDQVVGFQGVARDTTALHDLEAEKNEFLALVTHDLRTPLSTILGLGASLETLGDQVTGPRIQRMGEAIRRQAERISRLADDLYDVSRLEAHSLLLSPRPVDLSQVVEAALDSVDPNAGDVSALVERKIPAGVTVQADPRRLEQVVANLVANALEHGAAPVVVETLPAGPAEVRFAVRDHGGGVADSVVPVMFSRVHTLSRHQSRAGLGTGLGLFLVKGLVEAMGGRVQYTGSDKGAVFEVTLGVPRRPADSMVL